MNDRWRISYSADAQLAEIRLRLDGVALPSPAALLVEGPDDKRLFLPFARHPGLVVPCVSRDRVLAVTDKMTASDRGRMLALIDCDFEVAMGNLQLQSGLVVTGGTDVEADMLLLGLLSRIVQHLIPGEINEPGELEQVAKGILEDASKLAIPVSRARMAAQPFGIALGIEVFPFAKHVLSSGDLDTQKVIRTIHSRLSGVIDLAGFTEKYESTPSDPRLCKGDDLLAAVAFILRKKYRASNKTNPEMLNLMLRSCMADPTVFEDWSVVQRIRVWEQRAGVTVLR